MSETRHTFCRLCEAVCGLSVKLEDGRILEVTPDRENPLSRGFMCVKGKASPAIAYDPSRVLHPIERKGESWVRASWQDAIGSVASQLRRLHDEHGPDSIALYLGNPTAMSAVAMFVASGFLRSIGSRNQFSSMSVDNISKFWVAEEMYGDKSLILQRDWEQAKYMLVLGHNPRVSIFGQLSTRPRGLEELRAARKKGGRLVLVDPRRTETAAAADEHLRIIPGSDIYFLLALLNTIISEERYDTQFIENHCDRFGVLRTLAGRYSPELASRLTGLEADTIRRIAREFAGAEGAFVLGNTGVSQQKYSTANEWLIQALMAVTGNIDRPGGTFYNPGVVDEPHAKTAIEWDNRSRVGNFPRVLGEYPVSTLADEILTPGPGQIRALIVVAGNPAVTGTDTQRMRRALSQLDLLVSIDLFRSATAELGHWILPATSFYERKDLNLPLNRHMPFPFLQYSDAIIDPVGEARDEWRIFQDLHQAYGTKFLGKGNNVTLDKFFEDFLERRGKVDFDSVRTQAHGLKVGERPSGELLALLTRRGHRIDLAPERIISTLPSPETAAPTTSEDFPILLISRRNLRSVCSWLHLDDIAEKPNELEINDKDAAAIGVADGNTVTVASAQGGISAQAHVTDAVPPGVVCMQFGLPPGVNGSNGEPEPGMNALVASNSLCDELTGMPTLNGIPVRIEAAHQINNRTDAAHQGRRKGE